MLPKLFAETRRFALKAVIVVAALTLCTGLATAATTISTNIQTGGTLSVTGTSTLATTTATSIQLSSNSNVSSLLVGSDLTGAMADTVRGMVQFTGDFGAAPAGDLKQDEPLHAAGYWSGDQTADQYTNAVDSDATLGVGANSNFLTAFNGYVENDETSLTTPWIAAFYANGSYAAGANTTNAAGVYVQPQRHFGTKALNTYGVYIDDESSSHGANDWGLYVAGAQKKSYFAGPVGAGSSTPVANFQVANGSNATTTMEIGSSGQNKDSCLKLYRTDGSAIYAYVAAGATTFTLTTTACANVSNF